MMKVLVVFLAIAAVVLADPPTDFCVGRSDANYCWGVSWKVRCNNGATVFSTQCTDSGSGWCILGDAKDHYNSSGPYCGAYCGSLKPTMSVNYVNTDMPFCKSAAWDRKSIGPGPITFPDNIEWKSRMEPAKHDHDESSAGDANLPDWCKECSGGAKRQYAWLKGEYGVTYKNTSTWYNECRDRLYYMVCAKKFAGCESDGTFQRSMCDQWKTACLPQAKANDFDCSEWLGGAATMIPSVLVALAALLF